MRVLLADGQPQVRLALSALLGQQPGLSVVGEAANAQTLLSQAAALRPDVLLVDWQLPPGRSDQLLPALREACPTTRVIALSARPEARLAALEAGVDAFVSKGDPPDQLLAAIERYRSRLSTPERPAIATAAGESSPFQREEGRS
jgi:DNA-binding NarL/FixJ family response regulator